MRWMGVLGAGLAGLAIGGCGGSGSTVTTHRDAPAPAKIVPVSYDGQTCAPGWAALRPGTYDFALEDRGSDGIAMTLLNASQGTAVSRVTTVSPGARASVVARLRPGGSYEWRCQTSSQAAATSIAIQIPGHGGVTPASGPAAVTIVELYRPMARYTRYEAATLATLRGRLSTLEARLRSGAGAAARAAWLAAHLSWLALGQDDAGYGAFGTLGNRIDGTADGDPGTTSSPSFTGFHRVEFDLWRRHDVVAARAAGAVLERLVSSIGPRRLSQDLPDTTIALDSWALRCHEILEDALRDTLSGDDDYGSHTGLAAIGADVTATREMLRVLGGLLNTRAPGLVVTATRQLAAIDRAIAPRSQVAIAALPARRRQRIDATVDAALTTLAPVSELIQISTTDS